MDVKRISGAAKMSSSGGPGRKVSVNECWRGGHSNKLHYGTTKKATEKATQK
ncbi:hypothetical protein M7I_2998 [Glarea lozoyensis 74030]|uniref:Uncharacterized protein n=1 Tax=Glarea lozoyensis (strain ATCC 74030 / MF5533) TaxID=1104152 RepID=H0EKA4_GLAL7|nr:hypothetical protein M7I_2998 [Glarea lozoyensis 74030]